MNPKHCARKTPCRVCGGMVSYISSGQCVTCSKKPPALKAKRGDARRKAEMAGEVKYRNEKPCKHGHWERYTANGQCVNCLMEMKEKWRAKDGNYEKELEAKRLWAAANREYRKLKYQAYKEMRIDMRAKMQSDETFQKEQLKLKAAKLARRRKANQIGTAPCPA